VTTKFNSPEELVARIRTVASLPEVLDRINKVANHPHSSLADVAAVIADDVGLTVRLLRLVNSAFYGFPARIQNITHACIIVGTHQIRQLAMATSVMEVFSSLDPDTLDMEDFWRHSVGCAMLSRALAIRLGESDLERFFIAGLLHDIGRLVLLMAAPDEAAAILAAAREPGDRSVQQIEMDQLGFSHAQLGGALLTAWNLPPSLIQPVRFHHTPTRCPMYPREAAIVHWSDIIAHASGIGESGAYRIPPAFLDTWDLFGLQPDILPPMISDILTQLEDVIRFFFGGTS
jgi:HD-like signal output (HDOD) protein